MDPITTTAMISAVVGYLAKKLKDNKSIDDFFNDFTEATVNWIKPVFIKQDQPKEILENLQKDPTDELNQRDAITSIERLIRQDPSTLKLLEQMVTTIEKKDPEVTQANTLSITGSSNKTYQDINSSSITDNSIKQSHSGSGDNIGRDKISNI